MPFELEIEEMTAIFDLQERYIPKLVKARFTVPERAPDFELFDDAIVRENLQHIEEEQTEEKSAAKLEGEYLITTNTTK